MSREATVRSSLNIRTGNLNYQSQPQAFVADVAGAKGPSPGAMSVPTTGVDVDFSELVTPGLCRLACIGAFPIEWGVHDGTVFHPVGLLLPGESFVVRLSENLGEEHDVAGTGTTATVNSLHMVGIGGASVALVEAFEK